MSQKAQVTPAQVDSHLENEAQVAMLKVEKLRGQYGEDLPSLRALDIDTLRRSSSLRSKILSMDYQFFHENATPEGSFKRQYKDQREEFVAGIQSGKQSAIYADMVQANKAADESQAVYDEYNRGQEGLDYVYHRDGTRVIEKVDTKKLQEEIMDELRELAKSDPEQAIKFREFFLSNDTYVEKGLANVIPDDEIEYYPGSIKGPDPEDDPEAYSKWFATH